MTRVSTDCYAAVFEYIESRLFKLEPSEFLTDFEMALRNAIRNRYPEAVLRGCWFHFCQALRRKSIRLGLHRLIKSDRDAKGAHRQLMCLPLLPNDNIIPGFDALMNEAKHLGIYRRMKDYFRYVRDYWLKVVHNKNPLSLCNVPMRTTSSVESLHSKNHKIFPKHPHIFKFMECLKELENEKTQDMRRLMTGMPPGQLERRHKKDRDREDRIRYFTEQFQLNNINEIEFLRGVAIRKSLLSQGTLSYKFSDTFFESYSSFSMLHMNLKQN